MSLFELYLRLGFKHIIDINGYEHIIFILVLCAGYSFTHFRKILIQFDQRESMGSGGGDLDQYLVAGQ